MKSSNAKRHFIDDAEWLIVTFLSLEIRWSLFANLRESARDSQSKLDYYCLDTESLSQGGLCNQYGIENGRLEIKGGAHSASGQPADKYLQSQIVTEFEKIQLNHFF